MPSTQEIEIVLRNPKDLTDQISYYIDVEQTDFNRRWIGLLENNLKKNLHLEKNYCWLGWADSPRDAQYLCGEINSAIKQINIFNASGVWQTAGLEPYHIDDSFTPDTLIQDGEVGDYKPGLKLIHEPMNRLHLYFEELQGETWAISPYYRMADYDTKWAIRQLNILCHELESWAMSNRKKAYAPEWQRPSQITTFLNAPRAELKDSDYELFLRNRYDRELGGVYLHWAQVGKTQFEVFRDEGGRDIDYTTCSAINSLKFYSGEFDVEWGQDVTEETSRWHKQEQEAFRAWLARNNFDYNDPKMSLGYIKIGQVNLKKSFGTYDFHKIIKNVSSHLDIFKIKVGHTVGTYDYNWNQSNYKNLQIDFLRPGYDWSRKND